MTPPVCTLIRRTKGSHHPTHLAGIEQQAGAIRLSCPIHGSMDHDTHVQKIVLDVEFIIFGNILSNFELSNFRSSKSKFFAQANFLTKSFAPRNWLKKP